jgi:non-homologous end joining protein Ku
VKGYEYEKGKYVILKEEDFTRVDVEATQTVDIGQGWRQSLRVTEGGFGQSW